MQVVVLLLLVASLALLVSGLITGSTPLVVASIVTSLLAAYAISRYRNRQPAGGTERARPGAGSADRAAGSAGVPAGSAERSAVTSGAPAKSPDRSAGAPAPSAGSADGAASKPAAAPTVAASEPVAGTSAAGVAPMAGAAEAGTATAQTPAAKPGGSARAASVAAAEPVERAEAGVVGESAPTEPVEAVSVGRHSEEASRSAEPDQPDGDQPDGNEPPIAETDPPLRSRGGEPVWVIDGRPRYHLDGCGFLVGREAEPVPLQQAVEDGFTPCALCDPDSGLARAG